MPKNILIAALGEHPAVITGMVKALREIEEIKIDTVHVLHTTETGKYIGREGVKYIVQFLDGTCEIRPEPLLYSDPNSEKTSKDFLRRVTKILEQYQNSETYQVYLSLAGGRKNMSALMALTTQFFPSIRGVYHLLDKAEDSTNPTWPSIEEMELSMTKDEIQSVLDPPLKNMELIYIPYPGSFAQSTELWEALKKFEAGQSALPVSLTPEAESFFVEVAQPAKQSSEQLEVWLSQTAIEHFQNLGSEDADRFWKCFQQMRDPLALYKGLHRAVKGDGQTLYVYKRTHRQRPFFYTEPNPISSYPQNPVQKVIVCGLSVEYAKGFTGPYEPDENWQFQHASREPYKRLADLTPDLDTGERILLVTLGKTPMIATQLYTLLQESDIEGRPKIPTVAVIYPERNPVIRNGVDLLDTQFRQKGVKVITFPIRRLMDVESTKSCEIFKDELLAAIDKLRKDYSDRPIALSLSGGRKGMSALTLFAAQYVGIEQLYHTLITDNELEKQVEQETTLKALDKLTSDADRAERLFLDAYDRNKFELFTVPIIPLKHEAS